MESLGSAVPRQDWRSWSIADLLDSCARWLLLCGVALVMVTPRLSLGPVHFGVGDVLGVAGAACWMLGWSVARSRPIFLASARWPLLAVGAGLLSTLTSSDLDRSLAGLGKLLGLWLLPSITISQLFGSRRWQNHLLSAVSLGSLSAAVINIVTALGTGFGGGLPQVWGAVGGFQGYFQVLGIAVAFPRLAAAVAGRRTAAIAGWATAFGLHGFALLLTQTRGAWLAAVVAAVAVGLVWRRPTFLAVSFAIAAGLAVILSADWAEVIRERVQSVFQLEPQVSGFESSVIRIALAASAWRMFLAYPLTGVGLKGFPVALPMYSPPGLPLSVEMGPNQILTPIEGPHSTYLSLLAETGILGALAITGWVMGAWWALYKRSGAGRASDVSWDQTRATVVGAVATITVFNLFAEMNASGALPFVLLLSLAYAPGRIKGPENAP